MPPTTRVSLRTGRPLESTRTVPLRQSVTSKESSGSGPSERISGKSGHDPEDRRRPAAKRPPSILRRLTTTAERSTSAADMASRSSGVEASVWRSSTKGPCGMRYLPQAVRPKPRRNRPAPSAPPSVHGLPVLPVGGAEEAEEDDGQDEDDGDDLLDPLRVASPRRPCAGRSARRPAWAPGCARAGGPRRSRALSDPEADEGEAADADEQGDEALGHRARRRRARPRRGWSGAAAGRSRTRRCRPPAGRSGCPRSGACWPGRCASPRPPAGP